MCKHGTTVPMPIKGRVYDIDQCIAHLVAALNAGGIPTDASCCGHGWLPGAIALQDGTSILVFPTWEAAQVVIERFPTDIHGEPRTAVDSYTNLPAWQAPGWDKIAEQTKKRNE